MMTLHCSSPQNETLARIQQLGGPDLLNATRAAAESKSSTEYNKNTIRLIIQLAFEHSPNPNVTVTQDTCEQLIICRMQNCSLKHHFPV